MGICYIMGAANTKRRFSPGADDMVIAADAGYTALTKMGIKPDLAVGDFDSLGSEPPGVPTERHPVMKNDTDMLLAVKMGFSRGYRGFHIYGGMGGRTDHTIANIQTLAYIVKRGGSGFLFGDNEVLTVAAPGTLHFAERKEGNISVFAYGGKAEGVYLRGLLYPLENATLTAAFPLGVSNSFTGTAAEVEHSSGLLLVYWEGDEGKGL